MKTHPEHPAQPCWFALVSKRIVPMPHRHVPVATIKAQAGLTADQVLVRDHHSPQDPVLDDGASVDLAHGNVLYPKARSELAPRETCSEPAQLAFSINDEFRVTHHKELELEEFLKLFGLAAGTNLFRDTGSGQREHLAPRSSLRFNDGPAFHTHGGGAQTVEITINDKKYPLKPGKYPVAELKTIAGVPGADELTQIIAGKIVPLADDAEVCIVGCEVFVSHPRKGGSS